jgi:hypothetical protein
MEDFNISTGGINSNHSALKGYEFFNQESTKMARYLGNAKHTYGQDRCTIGQDSSVI